MSTEQITGKPDYAVGYGRPPLHTRFQKGQSGNPRGRPPSKTKTVNEMVLEEAYRPIAVPEGDRQMTISAFQAMVRSQFTQAIKGNGPAQRNIVELVEGAEARAEQNRQAQERGSRVSMEILALFEAHRRGQTPRPAAWRLSHR
jgi:hypothetical protein